MIFMKDLFSLDLFNEMLEQKYIRVQYHPLLPVYVLNYTEKAQYNRVWNDVTSQCRGLVANYQTGEILGRPFKKFHNYGTAEAPELDLNTKVSVHDKLDGSMILLSPAYSYDGPIFSSRGSFISEQAKEAVAIFNEKYDYWEPDNKFTYIFEVIYPQNRIVVDYGDRRDLVLLGIIHTETGIEYSPSLSNWLGPVAERFSYKTLAEALAAPPRPGKEGFVVSVTGHSGVKVKIKQKDYIALHRIVTGLSARVVWESLKTRDVSVMEGFIDSLPDEFHSWVKDVIKELEEAAYKLYNEAQEAFTKTQEAFPENSTRREFAEQVKKHKLSWALFSLLDGKDIWPKIWQLVKPEADWTPANRKFDEDNA